MAENSAFWLGSTLGDAASITGWKGPYSVSDFSNILSLLTANDDNQGFVIPDYENNLSVTADSPASMDVFVDTGAVLIQGQLYENTASNTLTIAANASGNPRIDRIILRVGVGAQTIRLVVLQGTPGAVPVPPTLTQDAATYEVSLAYIWVPNAAASIPDTDIHDEREFAITFSAINDYYGAKNLVYNSEFLAYSFLSAADPTTNPPDYWNLVGTPSAMTASAIPTQMTRGRAIEITADAASEGISQAVPVKPSTTYVIKLLTKVTSGDEGSIVVTTDAGVPGTITRYTKRVATWIEEIIYYTTESDATLLTIELLALNNTDVIEYGQVLIVEGYFPGNFREINETIALQKPMDDPNWAFTYAKSSGITTIDLDADYQALILLGTHAVYITHYFRDTGSAAGTCYIVTSPTGTTVTMIRVETSGNNQNTAISGHGWISPDINRQFDYTIVATGVNTAVGAASIMGIKT